MVRSYSSKENPSTKFYKTSFKLLATLIILLLSFKFLGPKIGGTFLLLSKHKNDPVNQDVVPPASPLFSKVPKSTNKEKIKLNGIAEPGSTIKLYVNGPETTKTTTNSEGLFTLIDIDISKGKNTLFAKAVDQENNESKKSKTFTIIFDDKAPEIEIIKPQNGEVIENLNRGITIKGKTNEKSTITINGKYAIVRQDNSFELLLGADDGDIKIEIKAIDEAENESVEIINVTYKKD